jgi:hypothetical protein
MRDPQVMADAILATLADPNPPDGRARAREFDVSRTAERYLQLLLPSAAATPKRNHALEVRPA